MGKLSLTGYGRPRSRLAIPPAASFTPATPSGLYLWYDASDTATITSSSGDVTVWADKSASAKNLGLGSFISPKTGTRTLNGRNVLDFNGSSMALGSTSISLGMTAFTVFVVCGGDTDHSDQRRIISLNSGGGSGWNTSNGFVIDDGNTSQWLEFYSNGGITLAGSTATPTNVYTVRKQGTGSNQTVVYRGSNTASATGTIASNGTATSIHVAVGHNAGESGDGLYFDGVIAEIIFYSVALSDADRDAVWTYLVAKWAL